MDLNIVHLEMLNILVALRVWNQCWAKSRVRIACDNEAVVHVLNSGRTWAGIHEKSYSQSQTQTYTQSQTQTQPYVSINSNLVFSCKILRKYMLKLKFESEIELRNILANQIP